jgi:beta-glucanase (GH16 family)
MNKSRIYLALAIVLILILPLHAQIGEVIWQENFNDLENWIIETGNGSWGWGNGELQFYKAENVAVVPIAAEPGNNALRITARQESGPGIVDQWGNPLQYTSGRLNTKSKIAIKYGVIEAKVKVPNINLGGWPAVWMLGTANYAWPRKGEIDIMEMGFNQAFRNLHDGHNGGNGNNNSTVNQMVGANALYYSDAAVNPDNPSGAASLAWDPDDVFCRPYYNYDPGITDRYLIYRVYWDPSSLRFTVTDNGIEYDLFAEPFTIDEESAEFQEPFHLVANLAIGGALTDAYNLGDPGSGQAVSMPLPAEMYIDYIKVMSWNNHGEVQQGPPPFEELSYGIFTDETPVNNGLETDVDAHIYVWENTLSEGSIPPYEGENGISWVTNGVGWFGAGIMSIQPVNLFNFADGHLKFMIKIPAHITFKIGIIDAWGNQNYVSFPAGQTTYGLVRNGDWGQAAIPVSVLRGAYIDLRMLSYEFVILEENGAQCAIGIDDIYWDGGTTGIIHDTVPAASSLRQNYPNPFNPSTTIGFSLKAASEISLEVFNIQGQSVKVLASGAFGAGEHTVIWNGTDSANQPVASGIYFYRLHSPEGMDTKKCILLK